MHPLERLVNLVALLLESRTPLTFDQIRDKLAEGYGHQDASSAKRMFERDKDVLRDIGVPIEVVSTDAWDVEHWYTSDKQRYYLPDIAFTPEELSALFVAVRSAGDISAEDAVRKLLSGAERGILAGLGVGIDRRLVGVRAVEQALGGDAAQEPGQFGDLGDVGLAIEPDLVRIEPQRQPGCGDLQGRALHPLGLLALHQRVVVGQEIERLHARLHAGADRGPDRAHVVAQGRGAGGGDAGEDATEGHALALRGKGPAL